MTDLQALVAHVVAAGVKRCFLIGAVPPMPEYPYAVLALGRDAGFSPTLDGHAHVPRRLTAQVFGQTAESVDALTALVLAAFNGRALPLDGSPVSEVELGGVPTRDPDDDGVIGSITTFRF